VPVFRVSDIPERARTVIEESNRLHRELLRRIVAEDGSGWVESLLQPLLPQPLAMSTLRFHFFVRVRVAVWLTVRPSGWRSPSVRSRAWRKLWEGEFQEHARIAALRFFADNVDEFNTEAQRQQTMRGLVPEPPRNLRAEGVFPEPHCLDTRKRNNARLLRAIGRAS
jgi:hypothetical protein